MRNKKSGGGRVAQAGPENLLYGGFRRYLNRENAPVVFLGGACRRLREAMGMDTSKRSAACCCGQLRVITQGEPVGIGMCHCLECQRRTGSAFGVQARFLNENVTIEGESTVYARTGDTGRSVTFHFCPTCGTTLFWKPEALPDHLSVAVGGFADPAFPAPGYSVYETRKHPWTDCNTELEHYD